MIAAEVSSQLDSIPNVINLLSFIFSPIRIVLHPEPCFVYGVWLPFVFGVCVPLCLQRPSFALFAAGEPHFSSIPDS
jgi:hypothetical protein